MKIQDLLFVIFFSFLLYKRNPKIAVASGLILLFASIPLFARWVFFTAERFVWYAAAFFLLSVVFHVINVYNQPQKK